MENLLCNLKGFGILVVIMVVLFVVFYIIGYIREKIAGESSYENGIWDRVVSGFITIAVLAVLVGVVFIIIKSSEILSTIIC